MEPKGFIKKDNLTFMAKLLWFIIRHCLSPTAADNIVTWDRAFMMAAMIVEFEVYFAWLLQAVMHERAFQVKTTYPFPCMIFTLCRSAGVPSGTLISSRLSWALLISASSGMSPMSWLYAEGPIKSFLHLVKIWLIQ